MTFAARLLVPAALLVFAAFYLREAGNIRVLFDTGPVGPADFPKLLVIALVVAVGFVVVGEWRGRRAPVEPITPGDLGVVGLVLVIAAAYVALFARIGFPLSTFALSLALLVTFARGAIGIASALLYALAITGAVYVLFGFVFDVRLPPTPFLDGVFTPQTPS
ncbi:MAG: tripartite tricarboxylate transporter TctB family protein [Pseudomonadota bacterium]